MASREERERNARDRVAGRILREYERRGTPVTFNQAHARATRIAERDYNERRDGKPEPSRPSTDMPPLPEGMKIVHRQVDERGRALPRDQ
jgi:hypothetical protein